MLYQKSRDGREARPLPCPSKYCKSSDAATFYYHNNSCHCYACGYSTDPGKYNSPEEVIEASNRKYNNFMGSNEDMTNTSSSTTVSNNVQTLPSKSTEVGSFPLSDRNINVDTIKRYGVQVEIEEETGRIVSASFPYFTFENEKIGAIKKVYSAVPGQRHKYVAEGNTQDAVPFGLTKFQYSWDTVTITEGHEDAMACNQMLGGRHPVISLKNGAQSVKSTLSNPRVYEWLDKFSKIIVCTDNDKNGQEAAMEIVDMFPPQKVHVVKMRLKDACEYLKQLKADTFEADWRAAKPVIPEGIKNGKDLREYIFAPASIESVSYPWAALHDLTKGIRMGEMTTVTAGTGMGKTLIMCEMIQHLLSVSTNSIGCLFLENSEAKTAQDIVGVAMSYPLRFALQNQSSLDDATFRYDQEHGEGAFEKAREAAYNKSLGSERIWTLGDKDFACNDIDRVISKVRYMAKVLNCKYIFLDHISIIVSSGDHGGDERKALDQVATKLRMLVHELNIHLFMVSHSKRPAGKSHEEGGQTSLSELRGTAGIGQLSDTVLGLERDGQNEDKRIRSTTLIRVLKNRFAGTTGPSSYLLFNEKTYRLTEVDGLEESGPVTEVQEKDKPVMDNSRFNTDTSF